MSCLAMSTDVPDTPSAREDEMAEERYEFPPGLMPDADAEYDYILANGVVTVYETGALHATRIKSDLYVPVID